MNSTKLDIIFFGTPDFAAASLGELIQCNYNVVAVVTAPDKPAGRGLKLRESEVKKLAINHSITVIQPKNLKDDEFINELKSYNADLFIVVAFRMLPEVVWAMPPKGTFNLHASLLPDYRGAAPINWAIMNGEQETGVTTFFINAVIDTGKILLQERAKIDDEDNATTLYNKLKTTGAKLLVETADLIANNNFEEIDQSTLVRDGKEIKKAPKIFARHRSINWDKNCKTIHNQIRGLSEYPCAVFVIELNGKKKQIKVFKSEFELNTNAKVGEIVSDKKSTFKIGCSDGYIKLLDIQQEGKKRMKIDDFLKGFNAEAKVIA